MLYEISRQIETELQGKGCPYRVVYGPERAPTGMTDPRVVIERDRSGSDSFAAPTSRAANPRMIGVRWLACKATVFAQSNASGAQVYDHERIADEIVDKLTVALHKIMRARHNQYQISASHFLSAEEAALQGLEQWPGAIYQFAFSIDRGVVDTTWTGAKAAEATMGGEHGVRIKHAITVKGQGDTTAADGALPSAEVRY